MPFRSAGHIIFIVGIVITILGLLVWKGGFSWLFNLPGDIRIEKENIHIYIPVTSAILISVVLTLILYLVRKIF